jgi:hypothetical protein
MRRIFIAVPAIALMMTMVALAQKAPDAKPPEDKAATDKSKALEELLAKALQNSPDVQVAEARLKEAEAALRQSRLLVAQKTVELQQSIDQKQQVLASLEVQHNRMAKLRDAGSVSATELSKLENELAAQKALIAQVESQVNMLIGKLPGAADHALSRFESPALFQALGRLRAINSLEAIGGGTGAGDPTPKRQPPQAFADNLRKLLNTPYKAPENANPVPLTNVFDFIRDATRAPILTKGLGQESVQVDFKGEVTLGAYFQILCDSYPGLQIYVRDYGFFATTDGPPDDGVLFMDFWHAGK